MERHSNEKLIRDAARRRAARYDEVLGSLA